MSKQVVRLSQPIVYTDSPSALVLETIIISLGSNPSSATLKSGLQLLADYVASEVVIPRPCSMYDCTGKSFTSHIERIHRSLQRGIAHNSLAPSEEQLLVATYHHHVSVDV